MTNHRKPNPSLVAFLAMACMALAPSALAQRAEGSFERTLQVTGPVDLSIRTGSGQISVNPGRAGEVRISARLRASRSWFSSDAAERIRQIESNPPIEQAGNRIRVGWPDDQRLFRNISIHYEVTVPAETALRASSGSGGLDVGDISGPVNVNTGSGSIVVGRIDGSVEASTGSGAIEVSGAQGLMARSGSGSIRAASIAGDVRASTGSGAVQVGHDGKGSIEVSSSSGSVVVTGVDGPAEVSSSSGGVRVEGRPTGSWNVHSSSGHVTLRIPQDLGFDLDARASSGSIESDHPVTVSGEVGRRRLQGRVRGGGPLVEVRTASGGITIK